MSFQAKVKPKAKAIPVLSSKVKAKVKNAHVKYYLRFMDLGDHSSEKELRSLLEAIQDAIRKRELTRENCDTAVVERMQRALVYTLNGRFRFSVNRLSYFSLDEIFNEKPNAEPKVIELEPKAEAKTNPKAKVKARAKKGIQLEPKQSPTTNSTIERATMQSAVPIQDAVVLKPNTEVRCMVYDISEKAKDFKAEAKTNTITNVTTNSTTKRAKPSNRQGAKIRSAKSIAQQEYNFFKAGDFSKVFGEVAVPFSLMVSGVPGSGKTSFLLQLIKHVSKTYARHRLLFVSNEERFNPSLGTKLKRFDMLDCDNLDIADSLPSHLNDYDFIFLDSVQSLRLSVEDFKQQINQLTSAGICLFFVFQATKSGSFRGSLEYEHEVDISLKVEGGRATVVKNRFGGSGYYQIF